MNAELLRMLKDNDSRLRQTEVKETVGNIGGYTAFFDSGTYTPAYKGATTPGATTYTTQVGAWRRVGDMLFFTAQVTWTAATGTGVALITLPLTAINTTNQWYAASVWHSSVTFGGSGIEALILPGTDYVQLYSPQSNAVRLDVAVEAAGQVIVSGMYFV